MTALRDAFLDQARSCAALGSPFMAQLCTVLAERLRPGGTVCDRLFSWEGAIGSSGHSVPLRLCGALHALKLRGCAVLGPVYPPAMVDDDTLWAAIDEALAIHAPQIMTWLDSPPQTNEVRRSVALLAAGHWLTARYDLPMVTRELGASGGLNLHWDHYGVDTDHGALGAAAPVLVLRPDWDGALPAGPAPRVAQRRGVDLNPLDPTDPDDALRLRAYLWADQPERQRLTQAAIDDMRPKAVDRADAIDWLADHLAPVPGHLRVIYHTVAWQYFPEAAQTRGQALIEQAGAQATADTPLAWVSMEADGGRGAALRVRLWPEGTETLLARVDFHGRWIDWLV